MPQKLSDLSKIVIESHERIESLEKQGKIDHERITVLEKYANNMSGLPARVDSFGQQVNTLGQQVFALEKSIGVHVAAIEKSMVREVAGLRKQQESHNDSLNKKVESGFAAQATQINNIQTFNIRQRSWWEVLQVLGAIIVGLAIIAEAVMPHLR